MNQTTLHANAVSISDRCLVILGPSGSGKSLFSLEMMALGARLIADDRTIVSAQDGGIWASCPEAIKGKIEARNVGLLHADPVTEVQIVAVLDLGQTEPDRLPPLRTIEILGYKLPLFLRPQYNTFAAAFLQFLRCDRGD